MSYQILYDNSGYARRSKLVNGKFRKIAMSLMILAGIASAVLLWGGDWSVTAEAWETMAEELSQGRGLQEAFSAFCTEILQGA